MSYAKHTACDAYLELSDTQTASRPRSTLPRMKRTFIAGIVALLLAVPATPAMAGDVSSVASSVASAVTESAAKIAEGAGVRAGSTCTAVREAILTGSKARIARAMRALIKDRRAPMVAREYARYYLGRDAGDPSMQELDIGLIQMSCS